MPAHTTSAIPTIPTGTLTSRKDFEYILANKKKDAVLIIDEAYVHFAGPENMSTDLVRQDKDVVVLRTFSKIYGMAGLRAGALYGRPDLLAKVAEYGRGGNLPVTATACAAASMKVGPRPDAGTARDQQEESRAWLSSRSKSWACPTFRRPRTSS